MAILNLSRFRNIPFVNDNGTLTREALGVQIEFEERTGGSSGAIAASAITFSPTGGLASTNAQAAIAELESEKATTAALTAGLATKQPLDATLTALAGLTTVADRLIYATGADAFAVTAFSAFARTLVDDADAATMRGTLVLGNVDNTSDANKPVSTATQTALDLKLRIASPVSTGTHYFEQVAQTSKAAAATLLIAELLTGIVQYTGAVANLTLPDGSDIDSGVVAGLAVDRAFEFSVINTGSGTVTIAPGASVTLVGTMTVTVGASGLFRVRKTAINTFTVYRVA